MSHKHLLGSGQHTSADPPDYKYLRSADFDGVADAFKLIEETFEV